MYIWSRILIFYFYCPIHKSFSMPHAYLMLFRFDCISYYKRTIPPKVCYTFEYPPPTFCCIYNRIALYTYNLTEKNMCLVWWSQEYVLYAISNKKKSNSIPMYINVYFAHISIFARSQRTSIISVKYFTESKYTRDSYVQDRYFLDYIL